MIIRHSLTNQDTIDLVDIAIGEVHISFNTKNIYTKTLFSTEILVGHSIRKLTDCSIYEPGVETGTNNFALVQFKLVDNELKLTTTYPFINITSLGNTLLDSNTLESEPYLGITDSKLSNKGLPTFTLSSLGDVDNLVLTAETHNYALASTIRSYASTEDPFIATYHYSWSLKPEATRLLRFDDTRENIPQQPFQVLRAYVDVEQRGTGVENTRLQISYDRSPELATDLDADAFSIYNQTYATKLINASGALATIVCDCNLSSIFTIKCIDVNILKIIFSYDMNRLDSFLPVVLSVHDFRGIIEFPLNTEFENGVPLVLSGSNHLLNCLVYPGKVRVLQKATNLSKAPL